MSASTCPRVDIKYDRFPPLPCLNGVYALVFRGFICLIYKVSFLRLWPTPKRHPHLYVGECPCRRSVIRPRKRWIDTVKETKLKKDKKNRKFSSLCPLSCRRLDCRQVSTHRVHLALTTHNRGISSRSVVHPPGYAHALPLTNPHHSPCLPDIQTPFS